MTEGTHVRLTGHTFGWMHDPEPEGPPVTRSTLVLPAGSVGRIFRAIHKRKFRVEFKTKWGMAYADVYQAKLSEVTDG